MNEPEKASREITNYLENLNDSQWEIPVNSKRNVREMVLHIAGWKVEVTKTLYNQMETGERPWFYGRKDLPEINTKMDTQYANYTNREALSLLKDSYREREEFVKKYGEKNIREAGISWIFEDGGEDHVLGHFKEIKEAVINE